jgi:ketosteroid isomerase-like protein
VSTATENGSATRTAAEWVEGFAEGWRAPTDADSFCDHFDRYLADEIRLVQPQLPVTVGKRAFREEFVRPLFELLSEIRGTVESWAAREDGEGELLFVELTIRATLPGGRPVTLHTIDKVTLRNGLAVERVANLDPLELLGGVVRSPRAWPRFARIQAAGLRERIGR